jgi:DNA-binding transcriptional MerR regulator
MVLFEGTNVSEGRGTTRPFEFIGAPWIDEYKLADQMNSKKYIEDLIEKVEEKDVDDDTELSIKLVRDYLKKNNIPREKLCSIFQDIWLDDPVKKWCEKQKEKEEHPFEELLKVTSNKNKSSMDFEDINQYIKNNDELIEKDLNPKKDYDFTNIFKNLKK